MPLRLWRLQSPTVGTVVVEAVIDRAVRHDGAPGGRAAGTPDSGVPLTSLNSGNHIKSGQCECKYLCAGSLPHGGRPGRGSVVRVLICEAS
jgi:hypothetical protein